MLGERAARDVVERALAASTADQTEVVLIGADRSLTRFARSTIHQNVYEQNTELRVRVLIGKRAGVCATNDLSANAVGRVIARASEIAGRQREDPELPDLAEPRPIPAVDGFHQQTADYSPERRARDVKIVCDLAVEHGLTASGAFSSGSNELAVGNSRGVWAYGQSSSANLKTVVMGDEEAAGYAERTSANVREIDAESLALEAVDKASRSRNATTLEPGEYQVVLEEYAVGEVLDYLSYMGFGALAYQEGRSFLAGRLGQQLMSPSIDIWDDGCDQRGLPSGFDFEGTPKKRVSLIEAGVARGLVHDRRTAARQETESTGHALPAPNTFGPFASNLFMAPGGLSKQQMAAQVKRGLWVTRFHYVNVLNQTQATLTGMTRDGTFLIENGEVGLAVRNLRFTQNMLEALSSVRAVGSQVLATKGFFGASVVPSLLLDQLNFTGVSRLET